MIAASFSRSGSDFVDIIARMLRAAGAPSSDYATATTRITAWADVAVSVAAGGSVAATGRVLGPLTNAQTGSLSDLEGDFALAAARAEGLVLARAPIYSRPLYYVHHEGEVVASSVLTALVNAIQPRPALDGERLAATIGLYTPADTSGTTYAGVHRLRPGEILFFDRDTSRARRAWFHASLGSPLPNDPETLSRALREHFITAVRRAMGSASRVAVSVSGGVDSSAVLSAAVHVARETGAQVEAITLDYEDKGDDRPYMRNLAESLGLTPWRVKPRDFGVFMRRAMVLDGAPVGFPTCGWGLGMMEVARERGAEVFLTGDGGDDIFNGRPTVFADVARRGDWLKAVRGALALTVPWPTSPWTRFHDFLLRPAISDRVPPGVRAVRRALRRRDASFSWVSPAALKVIEAGRARASQRHWPRSPSAVFAMMANDESLLEVSERRAQLERATGLRYESPMYEESLIRFVCRVPPEALLYGGQLRGLFRLAMHGLVPEMNRLRLGKGGCHAALAELLDGAGGFDAFADLITCAALESLNLVDGARYRNRLAGVRGRALLGAEWLELWPALTVEHFARGYLWERSRY